MLKLALKSIINEIDIWSSLDHKYILKLRGTDKKPKIKYGKDSKDGKDGKDGEDGEDGKDGKEGEDGEDSRIGHKG